MAKKHNNHPLPFFECNPSVIFSETAHLDSKADKWDYVCSIMIAWSKLDVDNMPEWMIENLSRCRDVSEIRKKAAQKRWSNANALQVGTTSNANALQNDANDMHPSLLFSSSLNTNEMSIGGKGEPRRVTTELESKISPTKIPVAEFLKAGPPIWMQWDFAALKEWNRLPIDYPTLDLNHVIAKAGEYRKKCEREKTETKFIKQPQNWLDAGMWSLSYEAEKEKPAHLTYVPCIPFDD